jgi:proteasome assembly chaperone 2
MSFTPAAGASTSFDGFTLVVASASHANVGQLAADLLINTLRLRRAGALLSAHVLPCVGNDALGDAPAGVLSLPLELYADDARALAVLQQRAPAARGAQRALAEELAAWAARAGFTRVLVLAGLDPAHAHAHAQIGAATFRYLCPHAPYESGVKAGAPTPEALGWTALESETLGGVALRESRVPPWPLLAACGAHGLSGATALLLFASEGDNAGDAAALADRVAALLALPRDGPWRPPLSWAAAFGARDDDDGDDIY